MIDIARYVGGLTPNETEALLREAIRQLPEETTMQVLKELLTMDQIDELVESLP